MQVGQLYRVTLFSEHDKAWGDVGDTRFNLMEEDQKRA